MRYMLKAFFIVFLIAISVKVNTNACYAETIAEGGQVTSMEELNAALGGNHTVKGKTIKLQDDILLKKPVRMKDFSDQITIHMNGKTVAADKNVSTCFWVYQTKVVFKGKGTYITRYRYGNCVRGTAPCKITICDGNFDPGANKTKIRIYKAGDDDRAKVVIKGGTFDSGIMIYNGNLYLTPEADDSDDSLFFNCPVDLTIDTCTVDNSPIVLEGPTKGDAYGMEAYGKHTISIRNGSCYEINCVRTTLKIQGGYYSYISAGAKSQVNINGGHFYDKGLDVLSESKLTLKNAVFDPMYSGDDECLLIVDSSAEISNCDIKQYLWSEKQGYQGYHTEKYGICIQGKSKVQISSLNMWSGGNADENNYVGTGIFLEGTSEYKPVLILSSKKGEETEISSYQYAIRKADQYATIKLKKNTYLKSPATRKKDYQYGDKIPDILKNAQIGYIKRKLS